MEYQYNNFNLAEIIYEENKTLSEYLETAIVGKEIKNLLLGPNLINVKYQEKVRTTSEDKDIINAICRLMTNNFPSKQGQSFLMNTVCNKPVKTLLKKLLKEIGRLIAEKNKVECSKEVSTVLTLYELISLFTCFRNEGDEEISTCDYILNFSYDGGFRLEKIETLQHDYEGKENLKIFYLMLYCLTVKELEGLLLCEQTREYFEVLNSNDEECVKRYKLINRFDILRCDKNDSQIRKEYDEYRNLYEEKFNSVKKALWIEDENKIFETLSGILLLTELKGDKIFSVVQNRFESNCNLDFSLVISDALSMDIRWTKGTKQKKISEIDILTKISANLGTIEAELIKMLMINNKNEIVNFSDTQKHKVISLYYRQVIQKIKNLQGINTTMSQAKFSFLVLRSNLGRNKVSSKINYNVIENLLNNYIQEIKNYYILLNALSLSGSIKDTQWPSNQYNASMIDKLLNEEYNIPAILSSFENSSNGILKLLKEKKTLQVIEGNDVIELTQEGFLKVSHSFGTFHYDLREINNESLPSDYDMLIKTLRKLFTGIVYNSYLLPNHKIKQEIIEDMRLNHVYYYYNNFFNFIINMKEVRGNILMNKNFIHLLHKDDLGLFKSIIRNKLRLSKLDFYYDNGYIFTRINFNRILEGNKNIANLIFKYNHRMFNHLFIKKISVSKFSYLKFTINAVRAYVRLTKIYTEKKVFKMIKNLMTDVIVENYNLNIKHDDDDITLLESIDQTDEIRLDFGKKILSVILPKLHSNLAQLVKVWRDYITDLNYLENTKGKFFNLDKTEILIKERLMNFKALLFLFSKKYSFLNLESLRKNGVLHYEFTKTISNEVLVLMKGLFIEFSSFMNENKLEIERQESVNFQQLIRKRASTIQEHKRRKSKDKIEVDITLSKTREESKTEHEMNEDKMNNLKLIEKTLTLTEKPSRKRIDRFINNRYTWMPYNEDKCSSTLGLTATGSHLSEKENKIKSSLELSLEDKTEVMTFRGEIKQEEIKTSNNFNTFNDHKEDTQLLSPSHNKTDVTDNSMMIETSSKYYTEEVLPKVNHIHLHKLKQFDEELEVIKKELKSMEIFETLTEQTSSLCLNDIQSEISHQDYANQLYNEIEVSLLTALDYLNKLT